MYFPYLYARRSELLALRDVSSEFDLRETVAPILEAVNLNPGNLKRCLQALGTRGVRTLVITNPHQGEFRDGNLVEWRNSLTEDFNDHPSLIPAFLCMQETTAREVERFLRRYQNKNVSLLYWSPQLTDAEIAALAANQQIAFHINLHDRMAANQRRLLPRQQSC